ncbi:hypothetical protein E5163_08695 [Marinicauda algicola]|uniref:Uncharacterized protein n=1 Tax=Marinicauda algicola TaxID=2029849 RepID=A0A4S2H1J1_9PROT|nr:hypothetical protein [Marinicauda algicola]TGY89188.1 hypothetical protein E5163_08695 [Marinicauda algicola]
MRRFFRRLGALALSGLAFAVALFLILQLNPASTTGWVVYGVLLAIAIVGTLLIYRHLMGSDFGPAYPDADAGEGYAPGILVGAGGQRRRRREEEEDIDTGIARGEEVDGDIDDPGQLI